MKNLNNLNGLDLMEFLPNKLKIKIDLINEYGYEVEKKLSAKLLGDCNVKFNDPIYVKLCAKKVGDDVVVSGEFSVTAVMSCARCLCELEHEIKKDNFFIYFKKPHTENINLTENLREDIIVSLPIRVLCKNDCKGLCSKCGTDLNKETCECVPRAVDTPSSGFDILKDSFEK